MMITKKTMRGAFALAALAIALSACGSTGPSPEEQQQQRREQAALEQQAAEQKAAEERAAAAQRSKAAAEQKAAEERAAAQRAAEEKAAAEQKAAEEKAMAEAERERLTPQWNIEDFGAGAAVAQTFTVTKKDEWQAAISAIDGGGNSKNYVINVSGAVDTKGIIFKRIRSGVKISLRGTGTEKTDSEAFRSLEGDSLTIRNITVGPVTVGRGSVFAMKTGSASGRVWVLTGGTFAMSDGTISGNSADFGGGVYVAGGTFTMSGGKISDNSAHNAERDYDDDSDGGGGNGGGVFVASGTFIMSGGKISGNSARYQGGYNKFGGYGGGVYVAGGAFTMSGGEISGNSVRYSGREFYSDFVGSGGGGGGVYVTGGAFTMSGGMISDNSSEEDGGGVYVVNRGTFTMSGGTISGNSTDYGGGVFIYERGTFTMSSGEISGNSADSGGGVLIYEQGTFTMSGGEISGNSGRIRGGGVRLAAGTFTMSGGTIYGSDVGAKANKAGEGAAFHCRGEDRDNARYGNRALILEGYRVSYIDETLTGVGGHEKAGEDVIGTWLDERGRTVVIIDREYLYIAENMLRWNRSGSRIRSGWVPFAANGFYRIPNYYKERKASDGFGNVHGGYRIDVFYSISGDGTLTVEVANSMHDTTENISYEGNQTFRLRKKS
jgi:hypothetical protein